MPSQENLTAREREILYAIVESYVETGEPVASRTLSKRRKDALSPASIRNVMADLYEEGYLEQPHTSAGRIPTGKAFRLYVQSLTANRRLLMDRERLRADLGGAESIGARIGRSSHLLMELTRNIGIAAAIPASSQTLDRIELLKLADRRVLMVVISRDQMVHDRVVFLPEEIAQDELNAIRNYLNENFSGWVLTEARQELRRRMDLESAAYDDILHRVMPLYGKGLLEVDWAPEISMEGAANLVGLDLHLTREKMRELFHALEEKKRMIELLDHFLEQPAGEIGVQIGLGDAHPAMKGLSLIGFKVLLPGGVEAKIAVL
ncbi:MAG: heat-inducible transcriptional repressor HrcA, partial [Bryobacteraceae bacterium]